MNFRALRKLIQLIIPKINYKLNLNRGSMTVKEYALKFRQLSKYDPIMVEDSRDMMSWFLTYMSSFV